MLLQCSNLICLCAKGERSGKKNLVYLIPFIECIYYFSELQVELIVLREVQNNISIVTLFFFLVFDVHLQVA